jgi:glycosyltransferase involved in cell wall biosynthesis
LAPICKLEEASLALSNTTLASASDRFGTRSAWIAVVRALDLLLAGCAALIGFVGLVPLLLAYGRLRRRSGRRQILHLVNGSIEATRGRSGLYYYGSQGLLGDLDGYFERVVAVFHFTRRRRSERLSETTELVDYHLDAVGFLERLGLHALRVVINELGYLLYLSRRIRADGVRFIQVTEPYVSGFNGALLAGLTGSDLAVLVTSDYDAHYRLLRRPTFEALRSRKLEKRIERFVFRQARLVVADRRYYADYALRNGARPEAVHVFPMSVHPAFYREPPDPLDARRRIGFDGGPYLLYVGRLSSEKHVSDLIEVLRLLNSWGHAPRLAIAGDGPLREPLAARARELGLAERLLFLGQLGVEDLRLAYAAADAILGTHMGFTLLEAALSAGTVVAYDWEWHSEIVSQGETGRLVPFGDTAAMAAAARDLLADPEARRLGRKARGACIDAYRPGRNVEHLRLVYSRILG